MSDYWFKPKRYGYGATPINWKGWVAVIVFVLLVVCITLAEIILPPMYGQQPSLMQVAQWAFVVVGLIIGIVNIGRAKTDGEWKWRWGDKD
jgi:uncharacterized membrane protein